MKDIKTLYNEAKKSRKESDIAAYKEAIQMYLESNPYGYISNLEYIITSDIGVNTLKKFVETNGLPIACYETVQEVLENAIHKCDITDKDSSVFKEASEWLSNYKKKYLNCFMMYEYYTDEVDPRYVESYYGFNDSGIQGRKLAAGMIGKFGESAIADALITSDFIGAEATATLHNYCTNRYQNDAMIYEWLSVTSKDLLIRNYAESVLSHINNSSLSSKVENSKLERQKVLREAVIVGNDNVAYEYSDNEIDDIKNLISFKEYMLTWADEFSESKITDIQKDIYSLYEELGYAGEFDESDADLVEMLPGSPVEEGAPWLVNTRDKKTGTSPTYINRNHDMANYGEDDGPSEEIVKSDKPDMSMDDYKRPSAGGSSINIDQDDDDDSKDGSADTSPNENPTGVQNYYYYTYNNSLNKNNHSFNKDNSTRDDHSVRNTGNTYDSSTGKHVNSHNNNVEGVKENPEDDDFKDVKESSLPWELDIKVENNTFTEAVGDADDMKPESDHPVKDILTDIDRATVKKQQQVKKKIQDVQNVGRAAMKPVNRTKEWVGSMIGRWKDADETNIKEKMADPHARRNLFTAIKKSVTVGSLLKAGLLLNPVFLFLTVTRGVGKNKREFRIRNEMIGEIKTEISIIDEKIKDADSKGDNKAKYQLMRFKNELNKKLLRVGGGKRWAKLI